MAKLIRLTEKEGIDWSHWQHPTNNPVARRNLAEYLRRGCPKLGDNGEVIQTCFPEGHELALLILGDDYISAQEVATAYGVSYTDEQLEHFADTLPGMEAILWLRANGYMLIAEPPTEMNLLEVRELENKLFSFKTKGWYAEDKQKFSREDKVSAGEWLAIRKEAVPNSFSKTWSEQQDLLSEDEYVPNAVEVSYAVTAYYKVRGIYLLRSNKYVRTSSVSTYSDRVDVGRFDRDGLNIRYYWEGSHLGNLGISSARKL
ncbi:MAG: hypothetical protein H6791_00735 [Candidatus Nomurabacteria bacterium]|nr:MAG: hypothetical protein H6791_00735 [Candidatus Nomurabacteria bacterium]